MALTNDEWVTYARLCGITIKEARTHKPSLFKITPKGNSWIEEWGAGWSTGGRRDARKEEGRRRKEEFSCLTLYWRFYKLLPYLIIVLNVLVFTWIETAEGEDGISLCVTDMRLEAIWDWETTLFIDLNLNEHAKCKYERKITPVPSATQKDGGGFWPRHTVGSV